MSLSPLPEFRYPGYTLEEAVDGLIAYDDGAVDSGIKDDRLRQALRGWFQSLDEDKKEVDHVIAILTRRFLTDKALADGYTFVDAKNLEDWLYEEMIL